MFLSMDSHPPKIMDACTSTLDRISSLPDNIIENILSDLPFREAVKTTILSSAWRNKWRYIPEIVFDNEFCQLHSNKEEVNTDKLIWLDIFRILSLHRGPITGLMFCIDKLKTCPEADKLFLFLREKPVQEFMFHFDIRESYCLPAHLFSYENLRQLTLSCCIFKPPPTFRGFHRLALLAFYEVSFECEDFHQSFISHCPLLEHLTMFRCTGIDSFVIDFPNLKSLVLNGCSFTSFCFKRSPLLATVEISPAVESLQVDDEEESSNYLIKFFDCLPALDNVRISYNFLRYLTAAKPQKRFPTDIQCIQALELRDISFRNIEEVSWVMCLVMSSPNLQNLKIKVAYEESLQPETEEPFNYEDLSDYSSEKLRRVEMENFCGTMHELEFVKCLLIKSVVLEEMVIKYPLEADPTRQPVMMKNMFQLPQVSPKAKIICLDPDESEDQLVFF